MDALTLLNSEPDLQSFKELFEEWWVDYEFDQRINVLLGQYPYTNFEERIDYIKFRHIFLKDIHSIYKIIIYNFYTYPKIKGANHVFSNIVNPD